MPGRKLPLITDCYYHIFNRGVARQPIFSDKRSYDRFVNLINFYRYKFAISYSKFIQLSVEKRNLLTESFTENKKPLIEIISFCLMPNHFHFLLKQSQNDGISKFISQLINGYTKYFNKRNNRQGTLFQGTFKAVYIETEEQLLHVSRYIHLNPYTSFLIKELNDITSYPYSSLPYYLGTIQSGFINDKLIINRNRDSKSYAKFIFDQADYQRKLASIKHLLID